MSDYALFDIPVHFHLFYKIGESEFDDDGLTMRMLAVPRIGEEVHITPRHSVEEAVAEVFKVTDVTHIYDAPQRQINVCMDYVESF